MIPTIPTIPSISAAIALLLHRLRRLGQPRAHPQPIPATIPAALYGGREHARADPRSDLGPAPSQPYPHHHRREMPPSGQHTGAEQRADRALRESEDRFRAIFNHAAVGMALCRADSAAILQANRRLAGLCALTQHALLGRRFADLIHPADRRAFDDALAALCHGDHDHACLELRLAPHDGAKEATWLRIHLSCTPADSRQRELAITAEDITAARLQNDRLQSQAAELARTVERLERSTRELEDFTYAACHDLKEPIRGLCTFAAFTLEDHAHQLDDAGKERLRAMQAQARRMESLLDALLRFSRYGRHEPDSQDTDLSALVPRIVAELDPLISARGAAITVSPLPTVRADPRWAAALFQELIQNALTFTDAPHPDIRVFSRPDGADTVLCVADDGIGIPERHRLAVFKMFKRLHARGRYGPGIGAGLAIAKRIVERHGGTIWAEPNHAGHGTTFCFTLPGITHGDADPPAGDAPVPAPHPDR